MAMQVCHLVGPVCLRPNNWSGDAGRKEIRPAAGPKQSMTGEMTARLVADAEALVARRIGGYEIGLHVLPTIRRDLGPGPDATTQVKHAAGCEAQAAADAPFANGPPRRLKKSWPGS